MIKMTTVLTCLPTVTSISWIFPVSYCMYKNREQTIETPQIMLLLLMVVMTILSCFFWIDPISNQNTLIHTMDAACARFTIFAFIAYNVILQPDNLAFYVCFAFMAAFFYGSDCCSKEEWCSEYHIYNHIGAHIFALMGIYFTLTYKEEDPIS